MVRGRCRPCVRVRVRIRVRYEKQPISWRLLNEIHYHRNSTETTKSIQFNSI